LGASDKKVGLPLGIGNFVVVFYYLGASEIWADKTDGLLLGGPFLVLCYLCASEF